MTVVNLNPLQPWKDLLRRLVEESRKGSLSEEFHVLWSAGTNTYGTVGLISTQNKVLKLESDDLTHGVLDLLNAHDLLFCERILEARGGSKEETEVGRICALTAKAYAAVDSNFAGPLDADFNLTDAQREFVRWLIKERRNGGLPNEFHVTWRPDRTGIIGEYQGIHPELYRSTLGALRREMLILCNPSREHEIRCTITQKAFDAVDSNFHKKAQPYGLMEPPPEIRDSLPRFKSDYPDASKAAFIMMQFGHTKPHKKIVEGIRKALAQHGISGLRADDKEYHADLFPNVLTYIFGCGFGVAVFERIEQESFNPNVALEVGYMLALRKQVCFLKDKTLRALQSDLIGKLYKEFDSHDPVGSIPNQLNRWLADRELIA